MPKTPGLNLPYGIDPVNPLPVDSNYGPYSNITQAQTSIPLALRYDGMTVMITGDGEYWWNQADLSNSGLKKKGSSGGLPIVRCVYLVTDAADVSRMGGTAGNAYNTAQAAYDSANLIQTTLGGNNQVIIYIQNTINTELFGNPSSLVGNITLTANWNSKVRLVGISPSVSVIGNIIATNAAGNGFSLTNVHMYNVSVNNINTNATGTTGNSGQISLIPYNCKFGNLDTSITNVANTTGGGGGVILTSLFNLNSAIRIGNITTRAQSTTSTAGQVVIRSANSATASSSNMLINSIITSVSNLGGEIFIGLIGIGIGTISYVTTSTSISTPISISGANIRNIVMTIPGTNVISDQITFNKCIIDDITLNDNGLGTSNLEVFFGNCSIRKYTGQAAIKISCQQCSFFQNSPTGTTMISQIGTNSIFINSSFLMRGSIFPVINGISTGVAFYNCVIIGGNASISNAANGSTAVNVVYTSKNSSFDVAVAGGVTLI